VLQSFVDVDSFIRCASSGTDCAAATCGCGLGLDTCGVNITDTIGYDTRCYFNVRSKADISQLNLPHGTDN